MIEGFEKDMEERERERPERQEGSEHTARVELDKFKLLMQVFKNK